MGFTPLAGLPMGTRSGDIDAGILEYLMNKYGMDIKEMVNVLNKKSGVMGVSGSAPTSAISKRPSSRAMSAPALPSICSTTA